MRERGEPGGGRSPTPVLRAATAGDLPAVRRLLREAGLPEAGLERFFPAGYAVALLGDAVAGVAGVEVHGRDGLLRSVAVAPAARGLRLGEALIQDRLVWARSQGLGSVWLLTTTASGYFPRFGFARAERSAAPEALRSSVEFCSACPDSAVAMRLSL